MQAAPLSSDMAHNKVNFPVEAPDARMLPQRNNHQLP